MKKFLILIITASLFACQNVTKDDLSKDIEILKSGGVAVSKAFCSEEMAVKRAELLDIAKQKFPQYPVFDVCPLINH